MGEVLIIHFDQNSKGQWILHWVLHTDGFLSSSIKVKHQFYISWVTVWDTCRWMAKMPLLLLLVLNSGELEANEVFKWYIYENPGQPLNEQLLLLLCFSFEGQSIISTKGSCFCFVLFCFLALYCQCGK